MAAAPALGDALFALRRRITYLMLFRMVVVTFLLVASFLSELDELGQPSLPSVSGVLFGLIAATYGLTIVWALLLRRTGRVGPLAILQLATDLGLTTVLVQLTGGAESVFVFMYLLIIVGASLLDGRAALGTAGAAVVLYALGVLGGWAGWLPQGTTHLPARALVRSVAVNAVAFAATGALAARLAVELARAGERIASQGVQLRDLALLHEDVIRGLTSGLMTLSDDGRVVTLNAAAEEILGVRAADVMGDPVDRVMPGLRPLVDASGRDASLRRAELMHRGPDGATRTLGISLSPLVDSTGSVLGRIANFQDLTELRRMEEAIDRAERLAAVGRLAAGIAHEIRNPLQAISGSIELLAEGLPADGAKDSKELMAIVLREVARLNGLITELLDFARPRRPEPQPLDLAVTLGELVRVFENDRRGAPVELRAPQPVWTEADPSQLRQVVWNLLRNAVEASPLGAPVVVEAAPESVGGRAWARLAIIDAGPGIPAAERARVFEPFFSTKEGGTGLGLATVHRIVEEHKGRVELECPDSGGTIFAVWLPGRDAPA
jgi:two-component system sensor histidine kinase PilS (NtrC family)